MFGYVDCFDGRLVDSLEIFFYSSKVLNLFLGSEGSLVLIMKIRPK